VVCIVGFLFQHFYANFILIDQLMDRYSQAGTPVVKVNTSYNPEGHTFSLKIRYTNFNFLFLSDWVKGD
jgi:hypothetical protein